MSLIPVHIIYNLKSALYGTACDARTLTAYE